MRLGSHALELGGPNKGLRRKTKALVNELAPLMAWEKLLAGDGGLRIFIFLAGDPGEEGAIPLMKELLLDTNALGEKGSFEQGLEIVMEPQGISHEMLRVG